MARPRSRRPFLALWTLAVVAACSAFILRLALRASVVEMGYELGQVHSRLARLREVKRVLELQRATYKMPERIDRIATGVLGMAPPSADRIIDAGAEPVDEQGEGDAPVARREP